MIQKLFRNSYFKLSSLLILGFLMSHCGGDTTVQPTFTSLYSNFFSGSTCSDCHQSTSDAYSSSVTLNMGTTQASAYSALTSSGLSYITSPSCAGIPIVNPGNYDKSLIKALLGSDSDRTAFTAAYPGCSPLQYANMAHTTADSATVSAIQTWINNGGTNN